MLIASFVAFYFVTALATSTMGVPLRGNHFQSVSAVLVDFVAQMCPFNTSLVNRIALYSVR